MSTHALGSGNNPQTMHGINASRAAQDAAGQNPWANGGRIRALLSAIPIATCCIILTCLSVYIYQLTDDAVTYPNTICVAPVIWDHEFLRVYASAFYHGGFFHVGMNCLAVYQIVASVEDALGTVSTLGLGFILLPWAEGWMYIFLEYFWASIVKDAKYLNQCALGYSGVIFAFLVLDTGLAIRRGETTRRFFGRCDVPTFLYPVVLLLAISIVLPNISFVGHLSGIFVGLLYVRGLLLLLTLPRQWCLALQRCLPDWLLQRPGWRQMPVEDNFAVWYPEFCRGSSFCPDAPNVDGGCAALTNLCLQFLHMRSQSQATIGGGGRGNQLGGGPAAPSRPSAAGAGGAAGAGQNPNRPVSRLIAPQPVPAANVVGPPSAAPPGGIASPSMRSGSASSSSSSVPSRPDSTPIEVGVEMGEGTSSTGGHYARLEGDDLDGGNDDVEAQLLNGNSSSSK